MYANKREQVSGGVAASELPREWQALLDRVERLPLPVRLELEDLLSEAFEHARFRERVVGLAREALENSRLEMALLRFDLDATREERERLRLELESRN